MTERYEHNGNEYETDGACRACGGELNLMGALGSLMWLRCRACGLQQSVPCEVVDIEEVSE